VYPAPEISDYGLSYGSDAGRLALLIDRLLDDITAPAADAYYRAPAGLEALVAKKWPARTARGRSELECVPGRSRQA
jgi:hypothetical protein